jgi:hypothetical protein
MFSIFVNKIVVSNKTFTNLSILPMYVPNCYKWKVLIEIREPQFIKFQVKNLLLGKCTCISTFWKKLLAKCMEVFLYVR